MTSYQRLQRKLDYAKQRGRELESMVRLMEPFVPVSHARALRSDGVKGDEFLTDVNMRPFQYRLSQT